MNLHFSSIVLFGAVISFLGTGCQGKTSYDRTLAGVGKSKSGSKAENSVKLEALSPGEVPKERKVYVSPEHTIYWPIEKPVWIRLASDRGDEANTYLLSQFLRDTENGASDSSHNTNNQGIKLEIPGKQFIRWVNHFSRDQISYLFVADGLPPSVQVHFTDAPQAPTPSELIFGNNLSFNLKAEDEHSGVKYVGYSLNGGAFAWYEKPISVLNEGTYQLKYYAVDNVGYASKLATLQFRVNLTPPTTELVLDKNSKGSVFGPKAEFTLVARDKASGIKKTFYKFNDEKNYRDYVGPIHMTELAEGNHVLYFFSEDNVANRETPNQSVFFLERSPPEIGHSFLGDLSVKDEISYISPRTRVRLDATDFHSNIKQIGYSIGGGEKKKYSDAFEMPRSIQVQTVGYNAENEFGIVSPEKKFQVFVDHQPPKTQHQFKGKVFTQSSKVYFISNEAQIQLSAVDEESGLQSTLYQLGDHPTAPYVKPFSIDQEGRHLLRFWSIDKVNNQESSHAILVVIDRTPPNILGVFSEAALVRTAGREMEPVYPVGTSLLINATDSLSGVEEIQIAEGKDTLKKYGGPLVFKEARKYEFTVVALDKVGNRAQEHFSFRIEKK